jgi:hypothetical protein
MDAPRLVHSDSLVIWLTSTSSCFSVNNCCLSALALDPVLPENRLLSGEGVARELVPLQRSGRLDAVASIEGSGIFWSIEPSEASTETVQEMLHP